MQIRAEKSRNVDILLQEKQSLGKRSVAEMLESRNMQGSSTVNELKLVLRDTEA